MSIQYLEANFIPNTAPADCPLTPEVAVEASVTEAQAWAFIQAAWEQAETFTGRAYRGLASGELLIKVDHPTEYRWPRYPFPETITAELWSDSAKGWQSVSMNYRAGFVDLYPGNLYRLVQSPTPAVDPMPPHVITAVKNLALYQLVHMPQRREFKNTTFADTSMTREAVMGALYGSGAGPMLASEVRR